MSKYEAATILERKICFGSFPFSRLKFSGEEDWARAITAHNMNMKDLGSAATDLTGRQCHVISIIPAAYNVYYADGEGEKNLLPRKWGYFSNQIFAFITWPAQMVGGSSWKCGTLECWPMWSKFRYGALLGYVSQRKRQGIRVMRNPINQMTIDKLVVD